MVQKMKTTANNVYDVHASHSVGTPHTRDRCAT